MTATLSTEILDIVEQLEATSTLTAVLDPSAISSALSAPPARQRSLIDHLVAQGAIEPSDGPPVGYVLTPLAREGLRERWARGWAQMFWPADADPC